MTRQRGVQTKHTVLCSSYGGCKATCQRIQSMDTRRHSLPVHRLALLIKGSLRAYRYRIQPLQTTYLGRYCKPPDIAGSVCSVCTPSTCMSVS